MERLWIEVFKAGVQTDSNGNTRSWTTQDLDNIAETYNNQSEDERHEAPVVIGHPITDSPAYGWVESLKREGEVLKACIKDLTQEFIDWVKKGLYKKRSIALYENLMLKHIGFLGAAPPAVKGLADPQFDASKTSRSFEFGPESETEEVETKEEIFDPAQLNRSRKFSIAIKSIGNTDKPEAYSALNDDDFADPVHYRFPISRKYIIAALATWSRDSVQKQYESDEVKTITARILKAAKAYKINLTPYKWAYVDIDPGLLSKKQLLSLINKTENNNISNNYKEIKMNEEQLNKLFADLSSWLSDTFGEEVANQTIAFCEELKAKYVTAPEAAAAAPAVQAAEEDKRVLELQQKIARLETDNRLKDHRSYCEGLLQSGKLTPAQTDLVVSALELGHKNENIQFAEAGKLSSISGTQLIKKLVESFPQQLEFGEQATNDKAAKAKKGIATGFEDFNVDESAMELHVKVLEFMDQQTKAGNPITYPNALEHIRRNS